MRIARAAALLTLLAPGAASSQMVGIYSDSLATSCNLTIPYPGPSVDVFVVFTPGPLADSLRGTSFRIEGLPEGWQVQAFANPNAERVYGSPFDWLGSGIEFGSCQAGRLVLYRVTLTPTSTVANHEMQVQVGAHPLDISCPWTYACEVEPGTSLPYTRALINGTTACGPRVSGPCPVVDIQDLLPPGTTLNIAPNPPISKATIHYSLAPDARFTRLSVYDLAGRLVAHMLEGAPTPREGSVTWDGRDRSGASVGAGVYIVRLQTDRTTVARKIVLIR